MSKATKTIMDTDGGFWMWHGIKISTMLRMGDEKFERVAFQIDTWNNRRRHMRKRKRKLQKQARKKNR